MPRAVANLGADARRANKLLESMDENFRTMVVARAEELKGLQRGSLLFWWNVGDDIVTKLDVAPEGAFGANPELTYQMTVGIDHSEFCRSRNFRAWFPDKDRIAELTISWTNLKLLLAINDVALRDRILKHAEDRELTVRELTEEINTWQPNKPVGQKASPKGYQGTLTRHQSHCQELAELVPDMDRMVYTPLASVTEPPDDMILRIVRSRESMEEAALALAAELKRIKGLEAKLKDRYDKAHPETKFTDPKPALPGRRTRPTK